MAEIIPFRGIIYNTSRVAGGDVVAPPYDIITPEYKEQLYNKSPYNIVRIDFGKELEGDNESENKYARAAIYFTSWLKEGALLRGKVPAFYAYEVNYKVNGTDKKLRGFFCLVRLVDLGKGVYPHECTHSKPKADRLKLMRACRANISPIFSLYNSPEKKASRIIEKVITKSKPYMEAKDHDGALHRLWIVEDEKDIPIISNDLKDKAVFIADGHHRYETALEFQKEMNNSQQSTVSPPPLSPLSKEGIEGRVNPWDYVLMFLSNIADDGLTILPAHRLIKNMPAEPLSLLSEYFEIEILPLSGSIENIMSGYDHAIGFYHASSGKSSQQYLLRHNGRGLDDLQPELKELDVTILHELIFKKLLKITDISYEMNIKKNMDAVDKGGYAAAFFLNPTKVEDVERVALSSVRMPPKSTYFYPKLLTGLVINKF